MAPLTVFAMLNPIAAAAAAGIINSIQVVSITMANGVTSASATITSAQTANTMLVWNSQYLGTPTTPTNGLDHHYSAVLTNATTITISRTGSKSAITSKLTAVEFKTSAIANIQTGSVTLGSGVVSANTVITSVVMADSLCHFNGQNFSVTANSTGPAFTSNIVFLKNATNITSQRGSSNTGTSTVYFSAVQFKPAILNSSTQQISITTATSGLVSTAITSAALAQSILFWGNHTSSAAASYGIGGTPRIELTSATTASTEQSGGPQSFIVPFTLVNFKPADIVNVQRGNISLGTGATTATATITSAAAAKTCVLYLSFDGSAADALSNTVYHRSIDLTGPTTITTQLGAVTTVQSKTSYEAITFT